MKDQRKPWILGLSTRHNGAAALLHGDDIVVAIQEERLLRMKRAEHPIAVPSLAMRYCLKAAGISPADLSSVAVCGFSVDDPAEDVTVNNFLQTSTNDIKVLRAPHHLSHAYGAFYMSGFPDSGVMVIDGHGGSLPTLTSGELETVPTVQRQRYYGCSPSDVYETASLYFADGNSLVPLEKHISVVSDNRPKIGMLFFHTLGKLYANVGLQIFGDFHAWGLDAAGKVMGLAPYGTPSIPINDFYSIKDDGFIFRDRVPLAFCHHEHWPCRQEEYANLAASAQAAIEFGVLFLADKLKKISPSRRLCYAGGVALNGVANERLIREAGFSDVFVMPAAEDSGTAIGAAFFALAQFTNSRTPKLVVADSTGRKYDNDEISHALCTTPGVYPTEKDSLSKAAELLSEGKIVAWFQGGSELGPRSLGQRSILCDPRRSEMKDMLNSRVKFREAFRPYAPVILLERAFEWLDAPIRAESPFMLRVMPFLEHKREAIPAVVHVDGTGRIQTVTRESNLQLFRLLEAFRDRTGVPLLLNTSLNVAGEPIAESPEDALWYLLSTGLDACVLEGRLVLKEPTFRSVLDFYPILDANILEHRSQTTPRSYLLGLPFWCISGPVELMDNVCERAGFYAKDYLSVVVKGPLGEIVHAIDTRWAGALKLMDGEHTGWQLIDSIRHTNEPRSERLFCNLLGRLRVGSGLTLSSQSNSSIRHSFQARR